MLLLLMLMLLLSIRSVKTDSATVDGRRGDLRDLDEGVQHGMLLA